MRIGFAGLTHGHVWGLIDRFAEVPGVKLASVADDTPLLNQAAPRFLRTYENLDDMLGSENLDAVVATSDNLSKSDAAVKSLEAGIPCFVEKPMAANADDAARMLEAMERSGKALMINWPIAWQKWPYALKHHMADPDLGNVFHFRFRIGHHGPKEIGCDDYFVGWLYDETKNGGGAIGDFCGYGAALAAWYFGLPETVMAVRGNYTKDYDVSDDHAVCLLKYAKRNVVLEGTWATYGFDDSANPVAHAKWGTLGVYGDEIRFFQPGQPVRTFDGNVGEIPAPFAAAEYFLECVRENRRPAGILDPAVGAMAARIVEAGIRSTRSEKAEAP